MMSPFAIWLVHGYHGSPADHRGFDSAYLCVQCHFLDTLVYQTHNQILLDVTQTSASHPEMHQCLHGKIYKSASPIANVQTEVVWIRERGHVVPRTQWTGNCNNPVIPSSISTYPQIG
jgi:hypothetical protein